ncbi:ABC-type transport auxiliary lipoprotein family protein [Pararobbsia silviterrae]|uniref:ABC transporter n=1 Tax=Pararobbsia silviterrae TaxID=1792498 RepID=A0A494YDG6_9BURK|nr:ABC-type transport auxiliary lipoprotein family protein [Pararobbsia silviterrae]RKP58768.1 ABC transporter [Pararobbsia silviterrae]
MRRPILALSRPAFAAALLACAALTLVAGCSVGGHAASAPLARFDFGSPPEAAANAVSLSTPIRVAAVSAPSALSTDAFQYRLSYADDRQPHVYATSRWTMPPPQLLTERLRDRIARQGHVLDTSDGGPSVPVLKLELDEFAQVFDKPGSSEGRVRVRATILHGSALIAQQTFISTSPAPSPDAEGGAQALASASDAVIGQVIRWLSTQNP